MADHPSRHYTATSIPNARARGTTGVSQRGRPRGGGSGRSVPSTMMRFVDSMMSPFVQCWQPPLDPCGACGSGPARHPVTPQPTVPMQTPSTHGALYNPSQADVLCGRGGSSNRHNTHFRELVAANKAIYSTLTKKQKMLFSRQVVDLIHQSGGRFLAKDPTNGQWTDVGLQRSLEKASQALREKTTNSSTGSSVADERSEDTMETKPNPRTIEAPPLIIPTHLKQVYRHKPPPVTPSSMGQDNPGWVADFTNYNDPALSRTAELLPPHMGALPFTPRQRSRLQQQNSRHPAMVSPMGQQRQMAWQQADYPSSNASCNSRGSSVTHSAPEFHQYYRDFEPPRDNLSTTPSYHQSSSTPQQQQHSRQEQPNPREVKRQRTKEEEDREELEEEEVILVDSQHQSTLNTSLQEGSEQLPEDVESKLCLQEKVVRSPSELLQGRGRHYYRQDISVMTPTNSNKFGSRLNTSAEAEGLAGLAALSTAAYLRMDEGE